MRRTIKNIKKQLKHKHKGNNAYNKENNNKKKLTKKLT